MDLLLALTPNKHHFVASNDIVLNGGLAFVGAALLETVYVLRRLHTRKIQWKLWSKLRSSDYNFYYDKGYTVQHIPKHAFGSSLAYSNRVLLVGSPYAGYGNHTNH